jgi:hypothetical protein
VTGSNPPPSQDGRPPKPAEPGQDDNRDFANIVALVFVVALAIGAFWLFKALERHSEIQSCIASGRRNCVDLAHPDASEP